MQEREYEKESQLEFHLRIRLKTNQWLQGLNAKKLEISCPKICCLTSPIRRGQLCCWWIQEPFLKNCFHPTWDPRLKSHYQCCLAVLHKNCSETQKEQVILDCQRDQVGREPVKLLFDRMIYGTSILTSHCGSIPSNWLSLKSKKSRFLSIEIQNGILLARPQDVIDKSNNNVNFGTIFALVFQMRWFPPR